MYDIDVIFNFERLPPTNVKRFVNARMLVDVRGNIESIKETRKYRRLTNVVWTLVELKRPDAMTSAQYSRLLDQKRDRQREQSLLLRAFD